MITKEQIERLRGQRMPAVLTRSFWFGGSFALSKGTLVEIRIGSTVDLFVNGALTFSRIPLDAAELLE